MANGFRSLSEDGYIQITDEFPSLVFLAKGTVNLDGSAWTGGATNVVTGSHALVQVPNTNGVPPLLALRCDVDVIMYRVRLVGSNWEYDIVAERSFTRTNTVTWYAFGANPNPPANSYGLRLRNAAGVVMFDSSQYPLINGGIVTDAGTYNIAAGKTVAMVTLQNRWAWSSQQPGGTWIQNLNAYSVLTGGNTAVVKNLTFGDMRAGQNFGFGAGTSGNFIGMLIDVSLL